MKISLAFAVVLLAATPSLATFLRAAVGFRLGLGPHEFSRSYGWGQGGRALGHGGGQGGGLGGGGSSGVLGQANKYISIGKGFSHGLSIKANPILPTLLHGHGHGKGYGHRPFKLFGINLSLGGNGGGRGWGSGYGGGGLGGGYGGGAGGGGYGKGWNALGGGGGAIGGGGYGGGGGYASSAPVVAYGLGGQGVTGAGYGIQSSPGGAQGYGGGQGGPSGPSGPSPANGPNGNGAGWANNAIVGQFSEGQGKIVPAYTLKTQTQPQPEYYYPTQSAQESKTSEDKSQVPQWHQADKVKILYVPTQVSNEWVTQQNAQEQQTQASNQQSIPIATSSQQTYQYTASSNNLDNVQAGTQQVASSRSDNDADSLPWTPIFTPTMEVAASEDNPEKSVVKRQLEGEVAQENSSQVEAV